MTIYGDSMEDRHWARKLNEFLDQESEPEYMYPPEEEIERWGQDSDYEYGHALIKKHVNGKFVEIYTSGYFVGARFYDDQQKEYYTEGNWRRK